MTLSEARAMRAMLVTAAEAVDDRAASAVPDAYPRLRGNGALIAAGTRIRWVVDGRKVVKKAAVDLWDTAENTPDAAPTLWEDIAYRDGERIIPAVITATLAFGEGELGWWGDVLYRSKAAANVWTPEEYPDNWEAVA